MLRSFGPYDSEKENDAVMGWAYSWVRRGKECIQNLNGKTEDEVWE
jgi:hypothetical protein